MKKSEIPELLAMDDSKVPAGKSVKEVYNISTKDEVLLTLLEIFLVCLPGALLWAVGSILRHFHII